MNTAHLNTGQVKVHYSDVSVIQMVGLQIPTVWYLFEEVIQRFIQTSTETSLKFGWISGGDPNTGITESSEYQTYITIPEFKGFKVRAKNNVIGWTIWILDQYSDPSKYTEMPWIFSLLVKYSI